MTGTDVAVPGAVPTTGQTLEDHQLMRIFVTGASGFIGTAVVAELRNGGHDVVGLARSAASAAAVAAAGALVQRGDLHDLDVLQAAAGAADGVVHLAFVHDFADYAGAAATDVRAIEAIGGALVGSDRPLVIASGTLGVAPGRVATEHDSPAAGTSPRAAGSDVALALAARGVRSSVVRLAPSVHGRGDHGFVPRLIEIARQRGVSGYVGDGSNRWSAIHRLDAARLFRLAAERAPAGAVLHGIAEQGVATRDIAEVIGEHLGLDVVSVEPGRADEHFGWLGRFFAGDAPASNDITRSVLGWNPSGPGLLADMADAGYFEATETR